MSVHVARSRTIDQPCIAGTRSGPKTERSVRHIQGLLNRPWSHPITVERDVEPPRRMRCVYTVRQGHRDRPRLKCLTVHAGRPSR
jgi:hypothetical protein